MKSLYNHKQSLRSYDLNVLEKKWQEKWLKEKTYSPNLKLAKKPFYNLMMFPYPSAEGLHVGNMYAFTGADVYGRFQRMNGYDVFEPIGLDGFGIHSENYAIKVGRHPKEHAKISEKNYYKQLHMIGNGYDWDRILETYDPDYYRWTQWLFIKMYKKGLAYKDKAMVNWCPSCKTVLADEQVIEGKCERCSAEVTKREMSSWFFKITDYADRLLNNIEKIEWPEKIKIAQRNWIGRSEGRLIDFDIEGSKEKITVFTTRPDTLNAVTFIATSELYEEGVKTKKGNFSGKYVISPLDKRRIPVWDTNYISPNYGTGYVMGVPAHDERDYEFAKKYNIEILDKDPEENKIGSKHINYHLRDWGISRQRYWGPPIPMINCSDCGWNPVPERDLPVVLPDIKDFKPQGDGTSPLHNAPDSWKKVKCPKCGKQAERELDVSDTFLDSSWYFLAYPNLGTKEWKGNESPLNKEITKKWLPVNAYIGGAEHAVLHLLYARFVTMVLKDLEYVDFEEPFPFLFGHGLIIKDGAKMSKSKGNVVNPDEYINKFGADTLRTYLMFLGPYDQGGDFRDTGIEGMSRFLKRVQKLFIQNSISGFSFLRVASQTSHLASTDLRYVLNKTIKGVTEDIKQFKYNTAIAKIMEFVNFFTNNQEPKAKDCLIVLAQLLAPFAPHLAEELWSINLKQKGSVHLSKWPQYDSEYLKQDQMNIIIQINGKLRGMITIDSKERDKEKIIGLAKSDKKIAKYIHGGRIKKEIFVPGKLINFVI